MAKWMIPAVIFAALTAGLGFYFLSPWQDSRSAKGLILKPDNVQVVAMGRQVYADNCAACHGANLEGQVEDWRSPGTDGMMPAPPHDETGHTWHHGEELLFAITKYGPAKAAGLEGYRSAMPAYDGILTDEAIIAVLSFIKSTWPEEIRKGHDQMSILQAMEKGG